MTTAVKPLRAAPLPTGYRAAQLKARSAAGSLTQSAASRVIKAIDDYAKLLESKLAALPADTDAARRAALVEARKIAVQAEYTLTDRLTAAITENRDLAFNDVLSVWKEAGVALAKAEGVPNALLGAIQTPNVLMAGAFESLGGVSYMKSLTASAKAGSDEVTAIIRTGITSNVSPQELARRLRPYVAGAEEFEVAFPKKDERFKALYALRDNKLSPELRNAAFKVRSNSLRIAYSEIHNARAEAELQAFAVDPMVAAVQWALSPFRGSQGMPDVCDALAKNNFYSLGVGIYPLDKVPLPPHPRDRCERVPVLRSPKQWYEPKPKNLPRTLPTKDAEIPGEPGMAKLTADQATRVRAQLSSQFNALEQHGATGAIEKLMAQGESAAQDLAAEHAAVAKVQTAIEDYAASAALAPLPPTVISGVTFPAHLEGDAYDAAAKLVKSAKSNSTTAIKALKEMGVDTSALEQKTAAKLAKEKEAKVAKKAAESEAKAAAAKAAQEQAAKELADKIAAEQAAKDQAAIASKAPVPVASADNVLYQAGKQLGGSNGAQVWVGKDGVARAVKVYKDASQAYGENLANDLYKRLGIAAPDSLTFEHAGKTYYASTMIEGVQSANELGNLGLTKARALKVLDGFAADLLTANWDAPGLSLDNLVEVGDKIYRVDNGSAFLFRAQGDRKPVELLQKLTEWDGFAPGPLNKNPQYAKMFETAGLKGPADLGVKLLGQIDRILQLEGEVGGWFSYVEQIAPDMSVADTNKVVAMLKARTAALAVKRNEVAALIEKAAAKPAPVVPVPSPVPAKLVTPQSPAVPYGQSPKAQALAQKIKLQWASGTSDTAWKNGVTIGNTLSAKDGTLNQFKKLLVRAVDGDPAAIKQLKAMGADTTKLEAKLVTAGAPAIPPTVTISDGGKGTFTIAEPHVPASHLITEAQVPGVKVASQIKQPLYFQGGNTTTTAILNGGVDFAKLPAGQVGFELEPAPTALKPTSKKYLEMQVVAKKALAVSAAVPLDEYIGLYTGKTSSAVAAMTATEKRLALLEKGFDAVIVKGSGGAVEKVIALKPEAVKVVDKVVSPALVPKPEAAAVAHAAPTNYGGKTAYTITNLPTPAGYVRDTTEGGAATQHLDQVHAGHAKTLNETERKAVKRYTGGGYSAINGALRHGSADAPVVKTLKKVIASAPETQTPIITYRGLGYSHPYNRLYNEKGGIGALQQLVGSVQHDLGFLSTSTRQSTALGFADSSRVILEVRVPRGTKGYWARLYGEHKGENELVLTARHEYRILEVREESDLNGGPRVRIIIEMLND